MADFAIWIAAAEPALGWPAGSLLDLYMANRDAVARQQVEDSPFGQALLDCLADRFVDADDEPQGSWTTTAADLLQQLRTRNVADCPKNARAMSAALNRLAPALRACGWDFQRCRGGKSRHLVFTRVVRPVSPRPQEPEPRKIRLRIPKELRHFLGRTTSSVRAAV
jgi:hypothetical protein